MKFITFLIPLFLLMGCQEDKLENAGDLLMELESLRLESISNQKEYARLQEEVENLKLDSIDYEEDYEKSQKIIEEQDARYNTLLSRWESQADKILGAQARRFNAKL